MIRAVGPIQREEWGCVVAGLGPARDGVLRLRSGQAPPVTTQTREAVRLVTAICSGCAYSPK
jgi:hypothetical protein